MPRNHHNHNHNQLRAHSGSHNLDHTRGPYQGNSNPLSTHNEPQAPSIPVPTSPPSIPQRQSDPFRYDSTGTIPYWDDFSGAIYEVPSIPPRHPGRTYAQVLRDEAHTDHLDHTVEEEPNPECTEPAPRDFEPSGLDWNPGRGDGPRRTTLEVKSRESRKRDFVPYLDPTDAQDSGNLSKKVVNVQTSQGRFMLGFKDVNQKLRQGPKEQIETSTAQRHASTNEATPSIPFQSEFQHSPVSKGRQEAIFEIPRTGSNGTRPMSTVVEEPSPLQIFKKKNTRPASNRAPSSPTLDRVRRLRDVEQKRTLEKLEEELKSEKITNPTHEYNIVYAFGKDHARSQSNSNDGSKHTVKAAGLIPDMNISDPDWAMPLYEMANLPSVPAKSPKGHPELNPRRRSMIATVHSIDDSDDSAAEETDSLVKTVADVCVYPMLPSASPNHRSFERKSAVPEGLDLGKIQAAKEYRQLQDKKMSISTHDTGAEGTKVEVQDVRKEAKTSVESFGTAASDDFERVGTPIDDGTEHNGARRKWYKGFRR